MFPKVDPQGRANQYSVNGVSMEHSWDYLRYQIRSILILVRGLPYILTRIIHMT